MAFLIAKDDLNSRISKIIVFNNKIENVIELERYLQSRLLNHVHNRGQVSIVI